MGRAQVVSAEEFFDGFEQSRPVYGAVEAALGGIGPHEVRITKSQIAFQRRRGFAYLWAPGRYLAHPAAPTVLSIVLCRLDPSPRFKEVAHPSPAYWMHHLEVAGPEQIDQQVRSWLAEAYADAG